MNTHLLKIDAKYIERKYTKQKMFEVRLNDRDYQVGDTITYIPVNTEENHCYHSLPTERIIYIHSGLGMQEGYVVLGLEVIEEEILQDFD